MSKPTVYIENSVISYLTARPRRDLVTAAWQQVTRDWWERRRQDFELYTSELGLAEASGGDPDAARERLKALEGIPTLPITEAAERLAQALLQAKAVPEKAKADALHIAIGAVHGVDYLLTWNCTHIDNAETKPTIRKTCLEEGYSYPEICTPQELMGDEDG